jgi:TonB family protein
MSRECSGCGDVTPGVSRCLVFVLFATLALVLVAPHVGAQAVGQAPPPKAVAFNLPAQPLASALEGFSTISGFQVVYDGALASGRWSASVIGTLPPDVALKMLLDGTGLSARYMADDGVMLVPSAHPRPRGEINTASPPVVNRYYGLIQSRLERALCSDSRLRGFRAALGFWIGPNGAIVRPTLLSSTGAAELDALIGKAMRNVALNEPPPAGFAQPVVMVITPDLDRDCRTFSFDIQARAER